MIDTATQRMIEMYVEEAEAPHFLAGYFRSPPRNFHTTEKVTIDILRDDEDIAIVVQDLSAGARHNEATKYQNKGYTPPIFKEEAALTSYDLMKRRPGEDPFQDPNFAANAVDEAFRIFRRLERKIQRTVELQASQVLQTGKVTLKDDAGTDLYVLDFVADATHLPTVGATWGAGGDDPLKDVEDLATVVRRDGKHVPNALLFGAGAFRFWTKDADVKARLDNRNMQVGVIAPVSRGMGATFQGWVWIGNYSFEMWTYDGFYRDPQTSFHVPYIDDDKVIMLSKGGRLDLTFGAIPRLREPEQRAMAFLPGRISSGELGVDLTTNAWFSPNGEHLHVSAGARPLCIPTAIDTIGCLKTTV